MSKIDFKAMGRDAAFRSAPFWAWNGKLDPEEIRREIRIMNEMNMGGFFMHSRAGLATEYMGKEWFECTRAAIDEAKKLNMLAYLYDEDRWPSGAAGGIITRDNKNFRMRYLECYEFDAEINADPEDIEVLGIFAVTSDSSGRKIAYRRVDAAAPLKADECRYKIVRRISPAGPWYNMGTYIDTTNPEAVQAFIDFTHVQYKRECGDFFGNLVPGFFTDEPNYLDLIDRNRRPWSDRLPALYKEMFQADIMDHLPELFFECGSKFSLVRYGFYRILTKLFTETFMRMIGEWCEKNNIQFTGHLLREDSLSLQIISIGAAMPGYEYMQLPGIDLLTEQWMVFNTAKQTSSVARQLGKKRVLSETYGCTGWDFPLSGHKALGDWQYICGVNFRCQHLYWYTMRGEAKRDYPASIGGQSPWYKIHAPLENYFARLGELLSSSTMRVPLLVLHPIETMWGYAYDYCNPGKSSGFDLEYDEMFDLLANELLGQHLDFDFGDETILGKYGAVEGKNFRVGQAVYSAVLLPQLETLRSTTVELLQKFVENGGKVSFIGEVPLYIDGRRDTGGVLAELYSKFSQLDMDNFAGVLSLELSTLSLTDCNGGEVSAILAVAGEYNDAATVIFAANTGCRSLPVPQRDGGWLDSRTESFENVRIACGAVDGKKVFELDLYSGELTEVNAVYEDGAYCWQDDFAPLQSHCYIIGVAGDLPSAAAAVEKSVKTPVEFAEKDVSLGEPNNLVLDFADKVWIDGELKFENTYILHADPAIRAKLNIAPRGGGECQPWCNHPTGKAVKVAVEYSFDCCYKGMKDLILAMESPAICKIMLNGQLQNNQSSGFWCDPALECVDIDPAALKEGRNELYIEFDYNDEFAGLEAVFLRGDFGVKMEKTITAPQAVRSGMSVTEQSLPCYAGNITYNFEFELDGEQQCGVDIADWKGSALGVVWDNGDEQILYAPPYDIISRGKLAAGKHTLQIKVYGHRRNAFGPFYMKDRFCWIGPHEFQQLDRDTKSVVPFGLLKKPEIFTV